MLHPPDRAGLPVRGRRVSRSSLRLPAHEATTATLGAAYPFAAGRRLPAGRVLVGGDLAGGPFFHDPFELYAAGTLTNPNLTVIGQIGRGKSALVKSYLFRQAAFGRQIAVLDPKGEYGPLARSLGSEPIRLAPHRGTRINPLEGPGGAPSGRRAAAEVRLGRLVLLGALSEATLRRRLSPGERLALELALDSCPAGQVTLGAVVERLLSPDGRLAGTAGLSEAALAAEGRDVGLELRRLVRGDLAGMFDGTTNASLKAEGGVLVVDLSELYHSEALPALMVCAAAWLQSMTAGAAAAERRSVFVVDEAWAVLSDLAVARYLRASWKLARARALANVAVCHRASDLAAAGSAESEEVRLAEGLLADSETVVCYAQPASELPLLSRLLGCSERELAYLPGLRRGVALWRVGGRRFLVEHLLSESERHLVDTDSGLLTDRAGRQPAPASR